MRRSGDGFVHLPDGRVFWGRFGAAGLLLGHDDGTGLQLLLARRSHQVHRGGGTWAMPGGAIDLGEDALSAARREFTEEIGPLPERLQLLAIHEEVVVPGVWSYHSCLALVDERRAYGDDLTWENDAVAWVGLDELATLPLFGPFAATLPLLLPRYGVAP